MSTLCIYKLNLSFSEIVLDAGSSLSLFSISIHRNIYIYISKQFCILAFQSRYRAKIQCILSKSSSSKYKIEHIRNVTKETYVKKKYPLGLFSAVWNKKECFVGKILVLFTFSSYQSSHSVFTYRIRIIFQRISIYDVQFNSRENLNIIHYIQCRHASNRKWIHKQSVNTFFKL